MTTRRGRRVRPLGAFERTIDYYMHCNPVQFSLVAEVEGQVSPRALGAALAAVQDRHPLLRVAVDRSGKEPVFRASEGAIPLTVAADGTPWRSVVAAEQTRPIPASPGPLARAVLVPGGTHDAVVLTFAHQIADGVGGLRALQDVVAVLGGAVLAPSTLPETQEDLLARAFEERDPDSEATGAAAAAAAGGGAVGAVAGAGGGPADAAVPAAAATDTGAAVTGGSASGTPPEEDERMGAPGELAPFSGRVPHVDALALDEGLTERLVRRCRKEQTSVHAALCAAAAQVFHRRGREFVRVLSPMDLRRAARLPDQVVVRFAGARTASRAEDAHDFWALSRDTSRSLAGQRTLDALKAGAAAIAAHAPGSPEEAEAMMTAATAADIQITNLGVADPAPAPDADANSAHALSALWGPAQITQLRGEHILGVVTVGGRLRMTELTHDPVGGLLPEIAAVLAASCAETPHD